MRKLKLQVQISIDGFIAGTNGELDWMTWNWDEKLKEYVEKLTKPVDCILLGRKLAEGFIPHWANVAADPTNPEFEAGKKYAQLPKVVFSRTLEKADWPSTELAKGKLSDAVNQIKQSPGRDIIVYGGAEFVTNLIKANLIDEYHLFVNPVALGEGMRIFEQRTNLSLSMSQSFECGITVLKYDRKIDE